MNKKICLIGPPNVGKSSLFNILTKSNQHTGNWTGKTVDLLTKTFQINDTKWDIVDLPGSYSLMGESEEEKITANYIWREKYDIAIVVLDATNIEISLRLLCEVIDILPNVIVCLNLYDEAMKKNIQIDYQALSKKLNVPVIITSAKEKIGIDKLKEAINNFREPLKKVKFDNTLDNYINFMTPLLSKSNNISKTAMQLLTNKVSLEEYTLEEQQKILKPLVFFQKYYNREKLINIYINRSRILIKEVVNRSNEKNNIHILDKILTNTWSAIPFMIIMLFVVLWITISLSNVPSTLLFTFFSFLEGKLYHILNFLPQIILNPLIYGGYRTLYWVISVMAPPMAIFFPLFSLLEAYGLFPRIAFNLDGPFAKCGSCGKQSLTMCMGLGCNAVGVTGTRIMENKKMKILAILTNVFMPCNGRFPTMISMISMFFILSSGLFGTILSSLILTGIIVIGIFITFIVTKLCNYFLFNNEKSVFVLEIPSYRPPKIIQTILISLKTKALDVLKRAIIISFPAGLLIYFLVNFKIGDITLFQILTNFLNPLGLILGLDGVILLAFLLGLPANEIVIPILLLGYIKGTSLIEYESLESLKQILVNNHWTLLTAINFLIICLCHFPCATTLLTIKEETKSWKYTILAFIIPTIIGLLLCLITTLIFR